MYVCERGGGEGVLCEGVWCGCVIPSNMCFQQCKYSESLVCEGRERESVCVCVRVCVWKQVNSQGLAFGQGQFSDVAVAGSEK